MSKFLEKLETEPRPGQPLASQPPSYEVDMADNGKEAVKMFIKSPKAYKIIILDLNMPEMNGYTAARHIRKRDRDITIVALTAGMLLFLISRQPGRQLAPVQGSQKVQAVRLLSCNDKTAEGRQASWVFLEHAQMS